MNHCELIEQDPITSVLLADANYAGIAEELNQRTVSIVAADGLEVIEVLLDEWVRKSKITDDDVNKFIDELKTIKAPVFSETFTAEGIKQLLGVWPRRIEVGYRIPDTDLVVAQTGEYNRYDPVNVYHYLTPETIAGTVLADYIG